MMEAVPSVSRFLFVDSEELLVEAEQILLPDPSDLYQCEDLSQCVICLDLEFKPNNKAQNFYPGSLLQIATAHGAVVLDLLAFSEYGQFIERLFKSPWIKFGHCFGGDLRVLSLGNPELRCFREITRYCDLDDLYHAATGQMSRSTSIATYAAEVLGVQMEKQMQCSDWEHRPLDPAQVRYAMEDATVLVPLFGRLVAKIRSAEEAAEISEGLPVPAVQGAGDHDAEDPILNAAPWGLRRLLRSLSGPQVFPPAVFATEPPLLPALPATHCPDADEATAATAPVPAKVLLGHPCVPALDAPCVAAAGEPEHFLRLAHSKAQLRRLLVHARRTLQSLGHMPQEEQRDANAPRYRPAVTYTSLPVRHECRACACVAAAVRAMHFLYRYVQALAASMLASRSPSHIRTSPSPSPPTLPTPLLFSPPASTGTGASFSSSSLSHSHSSSTLDFSPSPPLPSPSPSPSPSPPPVVPLSSSLPPSPPAFSALTARISFLGAIVYDYVSIAFHWRTHVLHASHFQKDAECPAVEALLAYLSHLMLCPLLDTAQRTQVAAWHRELLQAIAEPGDPDAPLIASTPSSSPRQPRKPRPAPSGTQPGPTEEKQNKPKRRGGRRRTRKAARSPSPPQDETQAQAQAQTRREGEGEGEGAEVVRFVACSPPAAEPLETPWEKQACPCPCPCPCSDTTEQEVPASTASVRTQGQAKKANKAKPKAKKPRAKKRRGPPRRLTALEVIVLLQRLSELEGLLDQLVQDYAGLSSPATEEASTCRVACVTILYDGLDALQKRLVGCTSLGESLLEELRTRFGQLCRRLAEAHQAHEDVLGDHTHGAPIPGHEEEEEEVQPRGPLMWLSERRLAQVQLWADAMLSASGQSQDAI